MDCRDLQIVSFCCSCPPVVKQKVRISGKFCLLSTTYRGFKDEKYMRVIVRVEGLTSIAKVLRTIGASKPFAVDSRHAAVA